MTKQIGKKSRENRIGIGNSEIEALCNKLGLRIYQGTGIAKDMFFCEPAPLPRTVKKEKK